jgi:hypothetical protein
MPLDLHQFQQEVGAWQAATFPGHNSPLVKAGKVTEEAGEVMGAVIKFLDGRRGLVSVAEEGADLVVALAGLFELLGIDLDVAVHEHWATVRLRDNGTAMARSRTIPVDDTAGWLDDQIVYWRRKALDTRDATAQAVCSARVDTLQTIRLRVVGVTLP